jgi:multidrug efflux pump subunit AcrA (membrane-fusion protein)
MFLTVLILVAASSACSRSAPPPDPARAPVVASVVRAALANIPERFEAGGVLRARTTATLASRVTAPVEAIYVSAGSHVRRGATLVTLESRELAANAARARASLAAAKEGTQAADADIRAAESGLTLARATHERVRTLFEKKSATAHEWDQASAALEEADARAGSARAHAAAARATRDAADAALQAAETSLSYATITAPFDGIVSERLIDPGTLAGAGTPLVVVEDPSRLQLHVLVDEFRARSIVVGQSAEARLDQDAAWTPARVAEVGRVDSASHSFFVKLDVASTGAMRSGLFGRGRFNAGVRRALTVPAAALVRRGQLVFVFTLAQDDVARLRPVVVGELDGDCVEILAGLAEGDVTVIDPPPALTDGTRVTRRP